MCYLVQPEVVVVGKQKIVVDATGPGKACPARFETMPFQVPFQV